MPKTPDEKRTLLIDRTSTVLGVTAAKVRLLLAVPRQQSVRVNTLKAHTHVIEELVALGWSGKSYSWFEHGYSVETGLADIRDSELVATGQVYIQNAASWLPVLALDPKPGEKILDMCAAPGGKTSHIAAQTKNQAHITANDNSRPRLAKLRANLERLGAQNVVYTLFDASHIAHRMEGEQFDKILLDAPCSGEGMMRLSHDKDIEMWSVAQIKRLQQLQKKLITQAWQLLKPGGTLVYSTCTMAPEENEAVIDYLLRKAPDAHVWPIDFDVSNRIPAILAWNNKRFDEQVKDSLRLSPSPEIEAFYVCKLVKS